MTVWLTRHASTAIGSLGRLFRQPFARLMIVLVIAVTLAIPAALNLMVKNAQSVSAGWDNALDFSVYLRRNVSELDAANLARIIQQRADVDSVRLITASEALDEFRKQSGFGEALDQLSDNPLPHTLVVRPGPANTGQSIVHAACAIDVVHLGTRRSSAEERSECERQGRAKGPPDESNAIHFFASSSQHLDHPSSASCSLDYRPRRDSKWGRKSRMPGLIFHSSRSRSSR